MIGKSSGLGFTNFSQTRNFCETLFKSATNITPSDNKDFFCEKNKSPERLEDMECTWPTAVSLTTPFRTANHNI